MPLWNMTDVSTGAPKSLSIDNGQGISQNVQQQYQNVTVGVAHANVARGVFGVDTFEKANATFEGPKMTHAGWVQRKVGTGYVSAITITNGGTGYTNGAGFLTFAGGGAGSGANASYNVVNGAIATIVVNSPGANYNVAPTVNAVATYSSQATLAVVTGGRVGRREYITLVAAGSMSRDANTDDVIVGG
jgi:hypothetical protein